MTRYRTVSCSITVILAFVVFLFRELILPHIVGFVFVEIGKDQVEYVGVPSCWMTFDSLLDILSSYQFHFKR
jgi:hypothetical protein